MAKLDRIQRKAMAIKGPGTILQSLVARGSAYSPAYLYKLQCIQSPPQRTAMVPPAAPPVRIARTRQQQSIAAGHCHRIAVSLPRRAPDYLRRSFPFCIL
eukprot:scpid105389/ scgid23089/ 